MTVRVKDVARGQLNEAFRGPGPPKNWGTLSCSLVVNPALHVTETLKWDVRISAMLSKASKQIHILKQ